MMHGNVKNVRVNNSELVNNTNKLDSQINRATCGFTAYQLDNDTNIKLLQC